MYFHSRRASVSFASACDIANIVSSYLHQQWAIQHTKQGLYNTNAVLIPRERVLIPRERGCSHPQPFQHKSSVSKLLLLPRPSASAVTPKPRRFHASTSVLRLLQEYA